MKVQCVKTIVKGLYRFGKNYDEDYIQDFSVDNELKIGEVYTVYGIFFDNNIPSISYLLLPEMRENKPFWYEAELFTVVDGQLPAETYYRYYGENINKGRVVAVWGYKELALDDGYFDDLVEYEPYALEIFHKRKQEIDKFINTNS